MPFFLGGGYLRYLLLLENLIFDRIQRSKLPGRPSSLGDLLLVFFFGLLLSLGQKFGICCGLFFLGAPCLQSDTPMPVLLDTWDNKPPNLGGYGRGVSLFLRLGAFLQQVRGLHLLSRD